MKANNYDMMKRIEELEAKTEDTGWIKATLTSYFKPYLDAETNMAYYRRIGKQVYIQGAVSPTQQIEGSINETEIFTLPERIQTNNKGSNLCLSRKRNKQMGVKYIREWRCWSS